MIKKEIYNAIEELKNYKPFIDKDEWQTRELKTGESLDFRNVHGGFEETNIKFSFCFPKKEVFKERFFHFVSPFPGPDEELASFNLKDENDKIAFAISHGAYYVETNMGSQQVFAPLADPSIQYKSSALAAEYSRIVAKEMYDCQRPVGIIYGGSGGGFKSIGCIENTNAFDGAVPYIIGSPMAMPNCHTSRVHAMRVLRNVMPDIREALEPGGSGDVYATLNEEEKAALKEVTLMGMPLKSWLWETMDSGALPVLAPSVEQTNPQYFIDFWEKEGFLGAVEGGTAQKDRIKFLTKVKEVFIQKDLDESVQVHAVNGADESFKKMMKTGDNCYLELEEVPTGENLYLEGTKINIKTGAAVGSSLTLGKIIGKTVQVGPTFGVISITDILEKIQAGDELEIDNSNYIAIQTLHRHICPPKDYKAWDQFRDDKGDPIYPQVENHISLDFAVSASGAVQDGNIQGKVIVVASVHDESAYPWQPDWYRNAVNSVIDKEEEMFRLWYVENSLHDDREETVDELHFTSYTGVLRQAILDMADWIQKDIAPRKSSNYEVNVGEIILEKDISNRNALQHVVKLTANGENVIRTKVGELIHFEAVTEFPLESGKVTFVEWSFESEQDFPIQSNFKEKSGKVISNYDYAYKEKGTYFAVVRVKAERHGNKEDIFTQMKSIDRVRVIVE
ncbi:MAG: hypothetical protein ACK5LM_05580 [Lactovum sp.]